MYKFISLHDVTWPVAYCVLYILEAYAEEGWEAAISDEFHQRYTEEKEILFNVEEKWPNVDINETRRAIRLWRALTAEAFDQAASLVIRSGFREPAPVLYLTLEVDCGNILHIEALSRLFALDREGLSESFRAAIALAEADDKKNDRVFASKEGRHIFLRDIKALLKEKKWNDVLEWINWCESREEGISYCFARTFSQKT